MSAVIVGVLLCALGGGLCLIDFIYARSLRRQRDDALEALRRSAELHGQTKELIELHDFFASARDRQSS